LDAAGIRAEYGSFDAEMNEAVMWVLEAVQTAAPARAGSSSGGKKSKKKRGASRASAESDDGVAVAMKALGLGRGPLPSASALRERYRQLAMKHHPDKGGDTAKMQEIQGAYDLLAGVVSPS
jgi:DnaJ-class molecular chaperone with C-terminal Zn finger domain